MEELVKVIVALAWPITIMVIVLLFRSDLKNLLGRISTLKYKEFEAQFRETMEELKFYKPRMKFIAAEGIESTEKIGLSTTIVPNQKTEMIRRLAENSPRSAILESWLELEKSIIEIAKNTNVINYRDTREAVRALVSNGSLPVEFVLTFNELRNLRNKVVHFSDYEPSKDVVYEFINYVLEMADTLNKLSLLYAKHKQE